jgi:hypothetical protein
LCPVRLNLCCEVERGLMFVVNANLAVFSLGCKLEWGLWLVKPKS